MSFGLLIAWAASAVAGAYIGHSRGRQTAGLLLGMILGRAGWLVILAIPRTYANRVQREADRQLVQAAAEQLLEHGEQP